MTHRQPPRPPARRSPPSQVAQRQAAPGHLRPAAEQLLPVHGGFRVRLGDGAPRPPTGTYNFVQLHGVGAVGWSNAQRHDGGGTSVSYEGTAAMSGKVIQGSFLGGRPKLATPVAQQSVMPRRPGPPAPAHVAQPRSARPQAPGGAVAVDDSLLRSSGRPGRPLPDALQRKMEQAFAADFSGVRVHEGAQAESIGAIAFTVGNDIWFAPGRFQPHTAAGQQLLGHG